MTNSKTFPKAIKMIEGKNTSDYFNQSSEISDGQTNIDKIRISTH